MLTIAPDDILSAGFTDLTFCRDRIAKMPYMTVLFHRQGRATISLNFEDYHIEPHTQVVVLPNTTLLLKEASDDFCAEYLYFKIEELYELGRVVDHYFFDFIKLLPCFIHRHGVPRQLRKVIETIHLFNDDHDNVHRVKILRNLLQIFFYDMIDKIKKEADYGKPIDSSRKKQQFRRFLSLIRTHCFLHRDVQFYADQLCITPRYLSSIVNQLTGGRSAKEVIDEHVIAEIKLLLQSSDMTLLDLVTEFNFPDQSFLGKYFRKHTGMTLGEFRRL